MVVIVDPPTWYLSEDCPCCEQDTLAFSTCPTCRLVVLICGEVGFVFEISGQQCGPYIGLYDSEQTCAKCGASLYSSFQNSTSEFARSDSGLGTTSESPIGLRSAQYDVPRVTCVKA